MTLHNGWGLLGPALLAAQVVFLIGPLSRLQGPRRWIGVTAIVAALTLLPVAHGLPAAGFLRAWTDDLSVTTVFLLLISLAGFSQVDRKAVGWLLALVPAAGIPLYVLSFGFGPIEPYPWGYASWWMPACLGVLGAVCLVRHHLITVAIAMGLAGFAADVAESSNLWDYLLDPIVVCYALAYWGRAWVLGGRA